MDRITKILLEYKEISEYWDCMIWFYYKSIFLWALYDLSLK